jgi:hypothetical protein
MRNAMEGNLKRKFRLASGVPAPSANVEDIFDVIRFGRRS